jgi:tetratricopeptide (TPR) repeat protein
MVVVAGLVRSWQRNADWRDNGTLFASAYQVHPTSVPVLYGYGQWLAEAGDPRGLELLERCVRMARGLFDAQLALGRAYLRLDLYDKALSPFQSAAMQQPNHPEARKLLAQAADRVAQAHQDDLDRLVEQYRLNGDLPALLAWTDALVRTGRVDEALAAFAHERDRFADQAAFHRARAAAFMLTGQRQQAIESYRTCLVLDPPWAEVMVELATALLDRHEPGDVREAEQLIDRAVHLAPDNPQVLIARAELLSLQGRREEAVQIYRGLLEGLPPGDLRSTLETRRALLEHGSD